MKGRPEDQMILRPLEQGRRRLVERPRMSFGLNILKFIRIWGRLGGGGGYDKKSEISEHGSGAKKEGSTYENIEIIDHIDGSHFKREYC